MPTLKLVANFRPTDKSHIGSLHNALTKLALNVDKKAIAEKIIDSSTVEAIKSIQQDFKLPVTGRLNDKTILAINTKLHDKHITSSKTRTSNLHLVLDKLKIGISKEEKAGRKSGEATRKAIQDFQRKEGLPVDGLLSEELFIRMQEKIVQQQFYTQVKNHRGVLLRTLIKVNTIAKLNLNINPAEIKNKELGASSVSLIKAFQTKYNLAPTGVVDKKTLDKINSVAASKGTLVKKLSTPHVSRLKLVTKELRLNTISPRVAELHKNLAFLGYKVAEKEYKTQTFGKTTIKAVSAFQKANGIPVTGKYDRATIKIVNSKISIVNPVAAGTHRWRIRGSVRNELWQRKNEMVVKVYELILDKESPEPLAAKKIFLNGFFDLPFDAPLNPANKKIKENFHLIVKLFTATDQIHPLAIQKHYNVNRIHWVNFTETRNTDGSTNYDGKYLGPSEYEATGKVLQKAIGNHQIADIRETPSDRQVSQLSLQTGLPTDEIMRHVLSCKAAQNIQAEPPLSPELFYAFLVQNLPPELPEDLLRGTSDWETIAQLTESISTGIAFLEDSLQIQAIENAVRQNLVSQQIKLNRDIIIKSLETLRVKFTLTKPILVGNGNLQAILGTVAVDPKYYPDVAKAFISNKGINSGFWQALKAPGLKISADTISLLGGTIEMANVSKNHLPTLLYLQKNTGKDKKFKLASDIAKLDHSGIVNMINENKKQVPANMPGDNPDEQVANFAAAIKARCELLYPAVTLVATTKRLNPTAIANLDSVETFIDNNQEFNFREQNLDKYIKDQGINLKIDPKTTESLKIVQRVFKLTTNGQTGAALIDQKMHSSMQIYFAGKERITKLMKMKGVDDKHIISLYEASKMQYMKVLARLTDFRREMYRDTPAAIIQHTYTEEEIKASLPDFPNLEILFGSMDFCECEHCKSLYGPAAYLTDMLRFLKEHLAIDPNKTVKDILFERRPDLGNIMLNCENTNTPLPYIDLVCEILENNLIGNKNFIYQTTLSQKELRAIPENIQPAAYEKLAGENFPMNNSFNLWQEETRSYLNYLRVPRYELMEAFQNRTIPALKIPDETSIAAEFFNLSWKEKDIIINARPQITDQTGYWGFDTTLKSVNVLLFMERSKLTYTQVQELLMVKLINDPDINKSEIIRDSQTCNTDKQSINNLTPAKLDAMHRFIRLWRKSGWRMWELDLLLRCKKIGNSRIDDNSLVKLKHFKQLQTILKLSPESLLAFYGEINREVRITPENYNVLIQPLYNILFQNISVSNPIDAKFRAIDNLNEKLQAIDPALPYKMLELDAGILLKVNPSGYSPVPVILSALALNQTDFDLLAAMTDKKLTVNALSVLLRYSTLARSLKLSIPDLLLLLEVSNTTDPFTDILTTKNLIENLLNIKQSGLSLVQLDYVLKYKPDSSAGLRDETISQLIEGLRRILEDSRKKINMLSSLTAYDPDALTALSDAGLIMSHFSAVQSTLIACCTDLSGADVTEEELRYIREFNKSKLELQGGTPNPDAAANKTKLVAYIKKTQTSALKFLADTVDQKQNQIKSLIASSFSITTEQANVLLSGLSILPSGGSLMKKLENENLITPNSSGVYDKIDRDHFNEHFNIYTLLHKSALLVSNMNIKTENLEYFIASFSSLKTLNFSALPVSAPVSTTQFTGWLNTHLFLSFNERFPEPENVSLRSILNLAKDTTTSDLQVLSKISAFTKWDDGDPDLANLKTIAKGLGFRHTPANPDYTDPLLYHRLLKCFDQIRLTGVDAASMLNWRYIDHITDKDKTCALQTRQAVKSKYEQDDWLGKITPLQDDLREKKRKALVEYHIDYSQRNPGNLHFGTSSIVNPNWNDSNSLFKYFLIDVEMSACQLTSRIKQALSSVQLFVQRCFLNLENHYVLVTSSEKDDVSSPNAWSQWKWMKNYRIWEANRKIFFYPENWLEPELRDDKSPFFKELENELLQNEVTRENVENAFLSYLHKLDEVSHLEVCGLYHQLEDLNPDEAGYETNIVHVIGKTKAIPNIFYYRSYNMNYSTWTAWEKIDVDISGDHVVPVVYNRKLHLFWLQFFEKPIKTKKVPAAQPSNGPTDAPEPLKVMELQLGWTIKKTEGWTTKKISSQKMIHPWERPHFSYNLKPYYLSKFNELYLDLYLSTSKEFNDSKFYDPNKSLNPSSLSALMQNPAYVTKNRFNETFLPWHSSSFVFNGDVKEVKLKGLGGSYTYADGSVAWLKDSFNYVNENFSDDGSAIKELEPIEFGPRLRLPNGMHYRNTHLTNNKLHLPNSSNLHILENIKTTSLLNAAANPFELVITQQDLQFNALAPEDHPFFYQDNTRAFFIKPEWQTRIQNYQEVVYFSGKYRFLPFYHPYTTLFFREFNRSGFDGLLNLKIQNSPQSFLPKNNFSFSNYSPTTSVIADTSAQTDIVDFGFGGSYSIYNWELFFHAPLMVACRLMQNQKFEDAMTWFHYIFNPTNIEGTSSPQRYWVTKPFNKYNSDEYRKQRIDSILSNLHLSENSEQLKAWRNNPFKPHVIARYRPVAYQKNVVMKYLDNLIAWGDMLFRRDTIESINEASLLYLLAYEILGARPQKVPAVKNKELTFNELESKLDEFGNARVDILVEDSLLPVTIVPNEPGAEPIPKLEMFYFCIPHNDFLSKYWDTVEDRLFKIRNCMNIEGIVRQLPLFEPPIDPALLVKAAAAGIDLSSVLNDLAVPTPFYRFRIVIQKALDFCNEVKNLGEKLLSAIEKKDAELLSMMHSQHEILLLEATKEIRKKQIEEADAAIESLIKTKESSEEKLNFYQSREFMNDSESTAMDLSRISLMLSTAIAAGYVLTAVLKIIPDFLAGIAGFGATPEANASVGGQNIGGSSESGVQVIQAISTALDKGAAVSTTMGSYKRREEEWTFQGRMAEREIDLINHQIIGSEIRKAIAEKELQNHELQIQNARTTDEYMRNKYTNDQLYNWMISQISTVYFQSYQLAFDMAKKAEKCFMFELGIPDSNIVQFGYWDSLKKGLLSGDKLMKDLNRLEAEYINQNKREFEITKHISLVQFAPLSLITLKETGQCTLSLPEWLFDMDYAGHYMRRIKNVSISIPCVVGPYTGINCMLSLLKNETRMDATLTGGVYAKTDGDDPRFKSMFGAISSIATSHGQNDSGMFELNFNDERYLPFEGAGVISDWLISMPKENNYFDFSSLSDVILHISYTSRNGGGQLNSGANAYLKDKLPTETARLFSLKHDFSSEWNNFMNPIGGADQELIITLRPEHFPFFIRSKINTLKIKKTEIFVESKNEAAPGFIANLKVTNLASINDISVDPDANYNAVPHASRNMSASALGVMSLKIKLNTPTNNFKSLKAGQVEDIFILFQLGI